MSGNFTPVNEKKAAFQQFSGHIDMLSVQQGGETISTPILSAELDKGDSMVISGEVPLAPRLGTFAEQPVLAKISMGENGSTSLLAVKVDPESTSSVKEIAQLLGVDADKADKPSYLLSLIENPDGIASGYTMIRPSTGFGVVGRLTNMSWLDQHFTNLGYDENGYNISPITNRTVSREQLTVGSNKDGFYVSQTSETTKTLVETTAMPEHQAIVAANLAAESVAVKPRGKLGRALGKAALIINKN